MLSTNTNDTFVIFHGHNPRPMNVFNGRQLGIGVMIKGANLNES